MASSKRAFLALLSTVLFLVFSPLHFAHQCWQRYALKQDRAISFDVTKNAFANVLATAEEALTSLLSEAQQTERETKTLTADQIVAMNDKARLKLDPERDHTYEFIVAKANGEVIGYAAEDRVPGKWGPIRYMIAFKPDGKIKKVMVLSYEEQRGKPVAKKRFLKQFRNKSTKNKIRFMKDIRGVTGASISSRGMADGVRKMTHVFEALYGTQ